MTGSLKIILPDDTVPRKCPGCSLIADEQDMIQHWWTQRLYKEKNKNTIVFTPEVRHGEIEEAVSQEKDKYTETKQATVPDGRLRVPKWLVAVHLLLLFWVLATFFIAATILLFIFIPTVGWALTDGPLRIWISAWKLAWGSGVLIPILLSIIVAVYINALRIKAIFLLLILFSIAGVISMIKS